MANFYDSTIITDSLPPLPADLDSAHKELRALQALMFKERTKFMNRFSKVQNDNLALKGTIKALHSQIDDLKKILGNLKVG